MDGNFFGRGRGWPIAALVLPHGCPPSTTRRPALTALSPTDVEENMRKSLPEQMFVDPEKSRLTMLRSWVLDHQVTEIEMNERQFWNFAALQPVAERPWTTFMGRLITVSDMPQEAQKQLGLFNKNSPGMI
jgi:hypothetical protein